MGVLPSLTFSRLGHPHPWDTSWDWEFHGREILHTWPKYFSISLSLGVMVTGGKQGQLLVPRRKSGLWTGVWQQNDFEVKFTQLTSILLSFYTRTLQNKQFALSCFREFAQLLPPGMATVHFCDHVFRTLDLDGNGNLDFKEYVLAMDLVAAKTPEEKLKWAFRVWVIRDDYT